MKTMLFQMGILLREWGTRAPICSARRIEDYGLSDRQSADASDRAVDSRGVLVRTNHRLQHFWSRTCRVGIKVHGPHPMRFEPEDSLSLASLRAVNGEFGPFL
jgi:hypothetical protein